MRIFLHTPRPELRPYIECIWVLESTPGRDVSISRIPPFGEVELAFHTGRPFCYREAGPQTYSVPRAHVSGPRTRYFDLIPTGEVGFLSVRFRPGAFHRFYPGCAAEIAGRVVPLRDLSDSSTRTIAEQILEAPDTAARLDIAQDFLVAVLRQSSQADPFVHAAMEVINASLIFEDGAAPDPATTNIDSMARALGMSRRTFQRKFSRLFGIPPRDYRRLLRFEAMVKDTLTRTGSPNAPELGDQALRFGYFDQSHFNKDFREYLGMAPGDFLREHAQSVSSLIRPRQYS